VQRLYRSYSRAVQQLRYNNIYTTGRRNNIISHYYFCTHMIRACIDLSRVILYTPLYIDLLYVLYVYMYMLTILHG